MSNAATAAWLADIGSGSVRDFYAAIGVDLGNVGNSEASIRCFANPEAHQHEDRNRSCSVNMTTGQWKCHGCGKQGNAYYAAIECGHGELAARRLAQRHGLFTDGRRASKEITKKPRLPTEPQLRKMRKQLWAKPRLIERLGELKAWTPYAIHRLGLGWDGDRLIFPIRSEKKLKLQGVVRYLPGGSPKTLAMAGTKRGLFPAPETLDRRRPLWLCEGESDAVSMRSIGLSAVAIPGAQSWRPDWEIRLAKFQRKFVLCDCDVPGRELAQKLGRMANTTVIDLDPMRNDGTDIGDWICEAAREGGVWQVRDMLKRLEAA